MRNVQVTVVEKIKTHISYSVTFLENRAVYEIMSKNLVEPEAKNDNMAHASTRVHTHTHPHTHTHTNM